MASAPSPSDRSSTVSSSITGSSSARHAAATLPRGSPKSDSEEGGAGGSNAATADTVTPESGGALTASALHMLEAQPSPARRRFLGIGVLPLPPRAIAGATPRQTPGGSLWLDRSPQPSDPVHSTSCRAERLNIMHYDPSAFHGDDIMGAWRQTDAEFQLRSPSTVRSRRRPKPALTFDSQEGKPSAERMPSTCSGTVLPWWHVRGIRNRSPAFHAWLAKRIGTRTSVCLVTSFCLFEAMRFFVAESAYVRGVNPQSIAVMANLGSLVLALLASFVLEGTKAFIKVFSWHPLWRFLGVAMLFGIAGALDIMALHTGASTAQVVTVGYVYMPISAILSYFVFRRRYGRLEWLAMGMLTLAILTFVFLREQSKGDTVVDIQRIRSQYSIPGLLLILCSVFTSVIASILAERIFKDRSRGLKWWSARYYVMKVHLDFGELTINCIMWTLPAFLEVPGVLMDPLSQQEGNRLLHGWFGAWSWKQYMMVFVLIGQNWLAGLLVKEFSTVMRAMTQSLCLVLVMCVEDPILGNRYHFEAREVPTVVLTVIIFLCAMIFQTGRINLRDIREAANLGPGDYLDQDQLPAPKLAPAGCGAGRDDGAAEVGSEGSGDSAEEDPEAAFRRAQHQATQHTSLDISRAATLCSSREGVVVDPDRHRWTAEPPKRRATVCALITTYALILVYTLSDAVRNLLLQRAMASTRINANTMGLVQYVSGVLIASVLTLHTHGWKGIQEAWQWKKVLRCAPAGFLFAVQATLMNMAYAQGISAALALILGRVYIPVAAIGARCVLGKFYMWLEYAAICILTLATVVFGYLKGFDIITGTPRLTHVAAMLLVMASATTAAFNSLITERILKNETVPFHLQKVRLDIASTLSSLALLPIVGLITQRVQDVPWVRRPVSKSCVNPVCWDRHFGAGENPACDCEVASGVFAGWTAESMPVILLALLVGVAYNWLVGKIVQRFSTVHRCIADSFSLLVIYFIGDPLLNHTSLDNMCLNFTAFIVPLSSGLFAVAASEMQWVMEAVSLLRGGEAGGNENEGTSMQKERTSEDAEDLSDSEYGDSMLSDREEAQGADPEACWAPGGGQGEGISGAAGPDGCRRSGGRGDAGARGSLVGSRVPPDSILNL